MTKCYYKNCIAYERCIVLYCIYNLLLFSLIFFYRRFFRLIKDSVLNLRVRREQLNKIKELGFKFIDCWELGFERILENERSELEKLDKKYYDLYTHVHTILENYGKKSDAETKKLDDLFNWYVKQDRSIDDPSEKDIQTLQLQVKKRNIHTFTIEKILSYFKIRKGKLNESN